MKRRFFLQSLAAAGLSTSLQGLQAFTPKKESLNILVLGGTQFVGPAIVQAAKDQGHQLTLFNRGISNPNLFPDLTHIKGDREKGESAYAALTNKTWDVIIDVWPEKSKLVKEATAALKAHCKQYVFISSIAVYRNFQEVGIHEESDVVDLTLPQSEWTYSEEKLAAEKIVSQQYPNNHLILRPGAIKGMRDPALDLMYWCVKLNRDDRILAPGSGKDPIQFVDVRDVGRSCVFALEHGLTGVFNCVGPKKALPWKRFLRMAKKQFGSQTKLVWADEAFLQKNKVYSFSDLPLWAPLSEDRGFMQISSQKLLDAGFEFRPVTQTLKDCISWYRNHLDQDLTFGTKETEVGLERSRELSLIQAIEGK